MSTNTPISTINLSSAASSITFSSIPQTYTDLVLVASVKSVTAPAGIKYRLNEDSGANYSHNTLTATGAAISGQKESITSGLLAYYGYTDTVNYGLYQHNFMNYTNTNYYKTSIGRSDNTSGAGVSLMTNTWRNNSAITSISVFLDSGNMALGSTFNLYGIVAASGYATGGDIVTTDGTYWYHAFTSSGTFTPTRSLTADYLVVAGGGGTGTDYGGGGGAGGLRSNTSQSFTSSTAYTITVGAGGVAQSASLGGGKGNNSSIAGSGMTTFSATGGGGGMSWGSNQAGGDTGGSGGGASAQGTGKAGNQGGYTPVEGYAGGNGGASNGPGGGGGGSAGVGGNGGSGVSGKAGDGGAASTAFSSWASATGTGVDGAYAGGGSGAYNSTGSTGTTTGGGGVGPGYPGAVAQNAPPGVANTGSGAGGGGAGGGAGAAGGSGIVIVRYAV